MFRSLSTQRGLLARGIGALRPASTLSVALRSSPADCLLLGSQRRRLQQQFLVSSNKQNQWRFLSSDNSAKDDKKQDDKKGDEKSEDSSDTKEIVMTPGEAVVAYSRLGMWAGIFAFAAVCAYYIARELIPTKMSPNRVFDNAFDVVRNDREVQRRYGEKLKGYGRDHGGHREGRRNFVEHTEYTDNDDGSKRTRVRFNIEGQYGTAFVFAEVSSEMPSGEFVYVLVQDKSNGRVHTVIDNRAALTAQRLAGGNKDTMHAMSQLLGGGKGH